MNGKDLIAALCIIAALIIARQCGYHDGQNDARADVRDRHDDSTRARLAYENQQQAQSFEHERAAWHHERAAWHRANDSTGRVIRRLQASVALAAAPKEAAEKIDSTSPAPLVTSRCAPVPAQCDTLIAALETGREQDSVHADSLELHADSLELQAKFWQSQTRAYQDTLVPALTRAREDWKKRAERPSYTITDIAGGILIGVGLAKDDGTPIKAGAIVIVFPRIVHAAKELLP